MLNRKASAEPLLLKPKQPENEGDIGKEEIDYETVPVLKQHKMN